MLWYTFYCLFVLFRNWDPDIVHVSDSTFLILSDLMFYQISIGKEEGLTGYMRGCKAACIRIMVASSTQLATYDLAKSTSLWMGVKEGFPLHLMSSIISSLVLVCIFFVS